MLLELTNIRSGAIVDNTFGKESADCIEIPICGIADAEALIRIDGVPARRGGKEFRGSVCLRQKVNQVAISYSGQEGEVTQVITLLWDRQAFKRYNFAIDDNVFFLTEIARERPRRLFDHFYLAGLKKLHKRYGTVFTLNCFYRDSRTGFEIKDFPDCYKWEFEENAEWLRLAFHAYEEFPDYPYKFASPEKLLADYELVSSEIVRFAGEKSLIAPANLHWGMALPQALSALSTHGMKVNTGSFIMTDPAWVDGDRQARICDVGLNCDRDVAEYIDSHLAFYDRMHDTILALDGVICNLTPMERIVPEMDRVFFNNPYYNTAIGLLTHEQYTFDDYAYYLPDHFQRMEKAVAYATEKGYKPVFFAEGLLGNKAWE